MSTKTSGNEKSTDTGDRRSALYRIYRPHSYVGTDTHGLVHHYNQAYGREYVDENGGRITVIDPETGDRVYTQPLANSTVSEWIDHVAARRGWADQPFMTLDDAVDPILKREGRDR